MANLGQQRRNRLSLFEKGAEVTLWRSQVQGPFDTGPGSTFLALDLEDAGLQQVDGDQGTAPPTISRRAFHRGQETVRLCELALGHQQARESDVDILFVATRGIVGAEPGRLGPVGGSGDFAQSQMDLRLEGPEPVALGQLQVQAGHELVRVLHNLPCGSHLAKRQVHPGQRVLDPQDGVGETYPLRQAQRLQGLLASSIEFVRLVRQPTPGQVAGPD